MSKTNYISRAYYGRDDVDIISTALQNKQNVLLLGPAGTGKSTLANVVADRLKAPFYYVPCHTGATAESLLGQFIPNPNGHGYVWMDGIVTHAVRYGGVLLLDEVNSLQPKVSFCIHGLLDHRRELILTDKPDGTGRAEVVRAGDNFGLIAAGNPDYEGTRPMNEAFRDRFNVQLKMGYVWQLDLNIVKNLPSWQRLEAIQRQAIESFIHKIRKAGEQGGSIISDVSTRAFIDFVNNIDLQGFPVARAIFSTRFSDDSQEQSAVRSIFRDVWDDKGLVQGGPATSSKKNAGVAGAFSTQANQATMNAAQSTF